MRTLVFLPFDRLNRERGALREADPQTHEIVSITSDGLIRSRTWHAQRLHLLLSANAHLLADLEAEGFTVHRRTAPSIRGGLTAVRSEFPGAPLIAAEATSFAQARIFADLGVETIADDFFLTPRSIFTDWVSSQRTLVMESFYRFQRRRLGILMDDDAPVGGTWNLDAENRLPPPKGAHEWPEPLHHAPDAIDLAMWEHIRAAEYPVFGSAPDGTWPTTRAGALQQLEHFLDHAFADFGPYEDAMPADTWAVNHSLLSPALNLGLITADEVVSAALRRYDAGSIPLASCEGFIRQLIGWREYVWGLYWHFGADYRSRNGLQATRALLPLLTDPERTQMACVRGVVEDIAARGWVHHIPRLMVLANLALLTGMEPSAFLAWMREVFVDAADWVMVPNVIGMGLHADGGEMMTKPYAAGGTYLSRMGRACRDCAYDPKQRTGAMACPFTTLYWDFLDRHREQFARNHRMAQQVRGLDRLSDLPAVRERAASVLSGLDRGEI